MILNSDQILKFIVTNGKGKPAQVGYDLTVKNITQITGGKIGVESVITPYMEVPFNNNGWWLQPGVYSLTFEQGIKLDKKHTAFIRHRSSLLRIGALITSGVFDPGFECEEIGATMFVNNLIGIEKGVRLVQIIIMENYSANKYEGSYQGDNDIK